MLFPTALTAQNAAAGKYSEAVVAKAEKVLRDVDLRRSGKTIQLTGATEISRALTALPREKRELRRVRQDWQEVVDLLTAVRKELDRLNIQYGELNLQLGRIVNDTEANNRVVGLINATNAKMKALVNQREKLKEEISAKRSVLNDAEAKYAETVLAIRADFNALREKLTQALNDKQVKIALRVMNTNFQTPEDPTADAIMLALDKRIDRIEKEVFSESVPLEVEGGSLYVNVVVGKKTARMVVDSGATMISLPLKSATALGIEVPIDARQLNLVLADGRSIPARGVTLPRVRVGRFEVENVDAAVLDAIAGDAEPLLGMSFLGNFRFEIDAAEKSLKLLQVEIEE